VGEGGGNMEGDAERSVMGGRTVHPGAGGSVGMKGGGGGQGDHVWASVSFLFESTTPSKVEKD